MHICHSVLCEMLGMGIAMKHFYYTTCSKEYLYKGLLLYDSLQKHDKDFLFFLVCMDEASVTLINGLKLPNMEAISVKAIEAIDEELLSIKHTRSSKAYAWAVKPCAITYVFKHYKEVDHIIWLDSDTCFMSSPQPIYDEWKDYSILLTAERFDGKYHYIRDIYGFFNTGFMGFRRDEEALKAVEYFRERLIEWNYDEKEACRWNDQLYVSDWSERFANVGTVQGWGINLTPFMMKRLIEEQISDVVNRGGKLYIGDTEIVLFHYYGFSYYNQHEFELCSYTDIISKNAKSLLYLPYIKDAIIKLRLLARIDSSYKKEKRVSKGKLRNYFILRGFKSNKGNELERKM